MSEKRGYTYREAAAYLGIAYETFKKAAAAGRIQVHYWGSKPLVDRAELDNLFESLPAEKS